MELGIAVRDGWIEVQLSFALWLTVDEGLDFPLFRCFTPPPGWRSNTRPEARISRWKADFARSCESQGQNRSLQRYLCDSVQGSAMQIIIHCPRCEDPGARRTCRTVSCAKVIRISSGGKAETISRCSVPEPLGGYVNIGCG